MLLTNNNHSTSESKSTASSNLQGIDSVASHHYTEFKNSAISDTLIKLNFRTITDSREVDKILNRNTRSRRKHSDHLIPAWCVSGIDPLTGENTLEGIQVKPDTPTHDKNGRIQKYLGASGVGASPLFLNTGTEYYWQHILENKSIPIIITEGAKKAGAGLSLGIPTISIPGVSTCRKSGRLHHWLSAFAGFGRTFYLCFDADILDKRPVQNSLILLARDLSATGSKVMIITLPSIELKGMDDFIAAKGGEEFKKLIDESPTVEEWKKELDDKRKAQEFEFDDEERKSKLYRAYKIIKQGWGESIRLNRLKKYIELDDTRLDLDILKLYIALEFDIDISKDDSHSIVMAIAKNNAYSPVVEYLDSLSYRYSHPDLSILDNLASKYFGTNEPLHNAYIKKSLIAAVARARRPGCKVDTACILVGSQGLGKSSFWRDLFGADWFTDELSDSNEKDELMKLHQFWGLEIPEVEHMYKRKDISTMKKFMSSSVDAFRIPYDREIKEHPRACVLVGTSNETELLNDPTGNRRFWIIPVSKPIPIDELARDRDSIWAAADYLYQHGHQWWLTSNEMNLQAEANKEYQSVDPWEETILNFVNGRIDITTHDILLNGLGIETGRQDKASERRVSAVMRQNGWQQHRRWVRGCALRVWRKVEKTSGSSGSSGSSLINQGFQSDPDSFPHLDHLDQYGEETPVNSTQLPISDPDDPDTKKHLDHPEPSHSKGDPDDPDDPDVFQTFSEKVNSQNGTTPIEAKGDRTKPTCQPCPITKKQMPAEFERTVNEKLVKFVPISFKRGGKSLRFVLYIEDRQFNTSIDWPVSKEQMILDLEAIASGFVRRYF
jgi:predicted P-loop ATPase